MIRQVALKILRLMVLFAALFACKHGFGQISGSLFMNTDNFYSQINNPSYFRTDNVIAFSIAGFAGFSVVNQGNFEIADVITLDNESNPVLNFKHFYEHSNSINTIRQNASVPVVYFGIPIKSGYAHFVYNENVSAVSGIREEALAFLNYGNTLAEYQNTGSGELKFSGFGYREFAIGYAKPMSKFLNVGIRAKLLFGAAVMDTKNWEYAISTSTDGDSLTVLSGGSGRLMVPFPIKLRADSTFQSIDKDDALRKYLSEYSNPGFAIDLGINYSKNDKHFISVALRDIGLVSFRNNTYKMVQDEKYTLIGFDLVSAIRYPEEPEYGNPNDSARVMKEMIREVYEPKLSETSYLRMTPLKSVLHYHYRHSERHTFGVTSQMAFQRNDVRSVLTFSAKQKWLNFSVFENLNLQGISGVTFGGGVQYEGDYAQVFIATDNIPAIYHPAANKTFSLNFGVCFLLNHRNEEKKESIKQGRGSTSPYLPFYKELRNKIR